MDVLVWDLELRAAACTSFLGLQRMSGGAVDTVKRMPKPAKAPRGGGGFGCLAFLSEGGVPLDVRKGSRLWIPCSYKLSELPAGNWLGLTENDFGR